MLTGEEGNGALLGLLTTPPVEIGWEVPTVTVAGEAVSLEEVLGQGGWAVVYRGQYKGGVCVVKRLRPGKENHLSHEQANLTRLATAKVDLHVPKLLDNRHSGAPVHNATKSVSAIKRVLTPSIDPSLLDFLQDNPSLVISSG